MVNRFRRGDMVLVGTKKAEVIEAPIVWDSNYLVRMKEGKYKGRDVSIKPDLLKPL